MTRGWVLAATVLAHTCLASAQAGDAAYAEARARFEEAVAAVQEGRPADAVGSFERSYAARAAPVVAVNLAYCLRGLGRFGEARRWYLRFLETASPDDLARHEPTVRAHLAEVEARLARVSAAAALPAGARLVVDGVALGDEARWIDAGPHRAEAAAPGHRGASVTFVARGGELVRLAPSLRADEPPFTGRWWFWTAVGVAVAGVTAAALVPALQPTPPAYSHPERTVP